MHCTSRGKNLNDINFVLAKISVDATMAGQGRVTVDVRGVRTHPAVDMTTSANNVYMVSFVPLEGAVHNIIVKFNECDVPGRPRFLVLNFILSHILSTI